MRLPQSSIRSLSVYSSRFLTCIALLVAVVAPIHAGASATQLTSSPSSLRFGGVGVGQTETLMVTLTNSGTTSVTVTAITVDNAVFTTSQLSLPLAIAAGQTIGLNVGFFPTATGWTGGSVKISSTASNPTLEVEVGGSGVASDSVTANPATVSFGSVAMGAAANQTVVLTNNRTWHEIITGIQITGGGFTVSGATFPLTLGAGQSVTLSVGFQPPATGLTGGSLFVVGPTFTIPLKATGTAATQYSVNLLWNSSSDATGYNVYRSMSTSGPYSKINSALDASTAYTDSTVASGNTYYYAATSVNSQGQESSRSSPVEAVIP